MRFLLVAIDLPRSSGVFHHAIQKKNQTSRAHLDTSDSDQTSPGAESWRSRRGGLLPQQEPLVRCSFPSILIHGKSPWSSGMMVPRNLLCGSWPRLVQEDGRPPATTQTCAGGDSHGCRAGDGIGKKNS